MSYKNKTYIAFDGDNDIKYYNIMKAWKENDKIDFNFYDAHDINTARDTSTTETIKTKLRERMADAKQMLLLVGTNTKYLRKFVPWEIELARKKDIPIIVVNLDKYQGYDDDLCPSAIKDNTYTMHIAFGKNIIKYALDNFPEIYHSKKNVSKYNHTYSYKDSVYEKLN